MLSLTSAVGPANEYLFRLGKYSRVSVFISKAESTATTFPRVWKRFNDDPQKVIGSHFGDQDWLWTAARGTAKLWPDEWIRSYKWEVRKDRQLSAGQKGERKFIHKENVEPDENCCIAVFHGDPNPHNGNDPWVVNNWK